MAKLFISYARADGAEIAARLADRLRALDHEVFLDVQGIPGGVEWKNTLVERIHWCDLLLVLITSGSNQSQYVYLEFEEAGRRKKRIIPIRVKDSPIPTHLEHLNALSFDGSDYSDLLLHLQRAMTLSSQTSRLTAKPQVWAWLLLIVVFAAVGGYLVTRYRDNTRSGSESEPNTTLNMQTRVVFASTLQGNTDLWIMDIDRANMKQLTHDPAVDSDPDFSPDGGHIVFVSDRDGDYELYMIDSRGLDLVQLTDNDVVDGHPVWSPDGAHIAFVRSDQGNDEIYVLNLDDLTTRNITQSASSSDYGPAWSPDSTQIAFWSNRNGNSEIFVMDSDGSRVRRVTSARMYGYTIDWSPDGTQLVFDGVVDRTYDIYVVDVPAENQVSTPSSMQRLTWDPSNDAEPCWSPDGEFIMFVSERVGNKELFVMTATGENPENIIYNIQNDFVPDWR